MRKDGLPCDAVLFDLAIPMMNPIQELCSCLLHLFYLACKAPRNNLYCPAHPGSHPWGIHTQGICQRGCSDLQATMLNKRQKQRSTRTFRSANRKYLS